MSSPHVAKPVHFRYAWGRNPMGNLKPLNLQDGPPLATQRSDDWLMHEVPVKFGDVLDKASMGEAREAHRLFDAERRVLDKDAGENARALDEWRAKWGR